MRTQGGRFLKIDHHEFGTPMWRSHCQYVAQIPIGVAKPAIHHNHVVQVNEIDNFGWSSKWNRSISKALLNILASCSFSSSATQTATGGTGIPTVAASMQPASSANTVSNSGPLTTYVLPLTASAFLGFVLYTMPEGALM